jgi:hypothetical protein
MPGIPISSVDYTSEFSFENSPVQIKFFAAIVTRIFRGSLRLVAASTEDSGTVQMRELRTELDFPSQKASIEV